jgi:hypothetical protein
MNKKPVPNVSNLTQAHKGQALLFVVVATTIAMVVGVNIANRSLSSAKRTTSTDTFTRVLNAAEGAIELAVGAPTNYLDALTDGTVTVDECNNVFGGGTTVSSNKCVVPYKTGTQADSLAEAEVAVSTDNQYDDSTPLATFLDNPGTVYEVNLNGYDSAADQVKVCWGQDGNDSETSALGTALYYVLYSKPPSGESSIVVRHGLQRSSFDGNLNGDAFTELDANSGSGGYDVCASIDVRGTGVFGSGNDDHAPYGLRIKSTHRPTNLGIFAQDGYNLPSQGYRIVAVGRLSNNGGGAGQEKISKTVTATKSVSFLPAIFDYAIYMHNGSLTKGGTN